MADNLTTFSSRAFTIPNYSAPLFVHVIDAEENLLHHPLDSILQDMFLIPQRRVVTTEKWRIIASIAIDILQDEQFWETVVQEQFGYPVLWRQQILDLQAYYRSEAIRQIERMREDQSFFAYQALTNLIYQASEGNSPDYEYGVATTLPLPRFSAILTDELIERTSGNTNFQFGMDDLRVWRQVNGLVLSSVSQEFKQSFAPLLSYEIPYGLSPQVRSDTLDALLKNSRMVAIIPLASGVQTVSTALATSQWLVALQAAATTGATVVILLGSIAISDVLIRWLRKREGQ